MQEEVESKTVTLIVSGTKLTGRLLKAAISKYLAHRKEVKQSASLDSKDSGVKQYGKISMAEIEKQFGDSKRIDLKDKGLSEFDRCARKYCVQYAVRKNSKGSYELFFKAPSSENMDSAFREYTVKRLKKAQRPSVLAKLQKFKEQVKNAVGDRTKRKEIER